MSTTTIATRNITRILSSSSSFMFSPKHPSLLPSLLLRRPISILSSTMVAVNSNSFAFPFIYTSSSPSHHRLTAHHHPSPVPFIYTSSSPAHHCPSLAHHRGSTTDSLFRVSCMNSRPCTCPYASCCTCDDDQYHWLASMLTNGIPFQTEEELFDYYVRTLAYVLGSQEEAKKRIYLISYGRTYGFGAELESRDAIKLQLSPEVYRVRPDIRYYERKNDPNFKPATFTPLNPNHRLENIFSYHYLSKRNEKWNSGHWLVIVKEPDVGFNSTGHVFNFIVEILTKVLGSEKEARERIYVIWYKLPFGFGAEIDKDASNKLRDMPDVLNVLPDYAFYLKDLCCTTGEALKVFSSPSQNICPSSQGSRYYYVSPIKERGLKEYFGNRQEQKRSGDASMRQQLDSCIHTQIL